MICKIVCSHLKKAFQFRSDQIITSCACWYIAAAHCVWIFSWIEYCGFFQVLVDLDHERIKHVTPQRKVTRVLNSVEANDEETLQFQRFNGRTSLAAGHMFWYASAKHNSRLLLKAVSKPKQTTEVIYTLLNNCFVKFYSF